MAGSLANGIAAVVSQSIEQTGFASGNVAIASQVAKALEEIGVSASVIVANGLSLSKTLEYIGLQSAWLVAQEMRVAVLVQTIQDVSVLAQGVNIIDGPFTVLARVVTLPGAKEAATVFPGAANLVVEIPGAIEIVSMMPGAQALVVAFPDSLETSVIAENRE